MSEPDEARKSHGDVEDPVMERLVQNRRPGEIESGMLSGSDDGEISATERFEGEVTEECALELLAPDRSG